MRSTLVASSDPRAEQAARGTVADGGGSIDAVIAGFFGVAGARPEVLLSPTVALVAGVGMGARCIDGRPLQPGLASQRPRGFVGSAAIPPGAYVATPRSIAAVALLHAYGARKDMSTLAHKGIGLARAHGAQRRAALIASIGQHGAAALRTGETLRALLWAGGRTAGGLLSEADLDEAMPGDQPALSRALSPLLALALPPGCTDAEALRHEVNHDRARATEVVVATETRGLVAALSVSPDPTGIPVPELELTLPRDAAPVRRGISRVTPGTIRPAAAPIAILRCTEEGFFAAVGLAGASSVSGTVADDDVGAMSAQLRHWRQHHGAREALAATVQRRAVALVRCGPDDQPG